MSLEINNWKSEQKSRAPQFFDTIADKNERQCTFLIGTMSYFSDCISFHKWLSLSDEIMIVYQLILKSKKIPWKSVHKIDRPLWRSLLHFKISINSRTETFHVWGLLNPGIETFSILHACRWGFNHWLLLVFYLY